MTNTEQDKITGRLVDAETGATILVRRNPWQQGEWAKDHKGWVLRARSSYARRTGGKLRWIPETN